MRTASSGLMIGDDQLLTHIAARIHDAGKHIATPLMWLTLNLIPCSVVMHSHNSNINQL
jgi:hypothetical protein